MIRALYVEPAARPVTLQERAVLFFVVRTVFHFPPLKISTTYPVAEATLFHESVTEETVDDFAVRPETHAILVVAAIFV